MSIVLYCLKVTLCSGILFGYYHLFLRNKRFHHYNRFYLLACLVLSIVVPLFRIPVFEDAGMMNQVAYQTMKAVTFQAPVGEAAGVEATAADYFTAANLLWLLYATGVGFLLWGVIRGLLYIRHISRQYPYEPMQRMRFYQTHEPGTPFSFFRSIYWNEALNFNSVEGQQIFRHELFHVQQRHTVDTLLAEAVTILGWFNPFFHLIRKELKAIHEFLADQYAISNSNRYQYAELLVQQVMTSRAADLASPFFQNQLKRRIAMITQLNQSSYGYWSRVMILPVSVILFFSVTLHAQEKAADKAVQYAQAAEQSVPVADTVPLKILKEQLFQLKQKTIKDSVAQHLIVSYERVLLLNTMKAQYEKALQEHQQLHNGLQKNAYSETSLKEKVQKEQLLKSALEQYKIAAKQQELSFFYNQSQLKGSELEVVKKKQEILIESLKRQELKPNDPVAAATRQELIKLKQQQQLIMDTALLSKNYNEYKQSAEKESDYLQVLKNKIKAQNDEQQANKKQLLDLVQKKASELNQQDKVVLEKIYHNQQSAGAYQQSLLALKLQEAAQNDSTSIKLIRYFNRSFRYPQDMIDNDGEGSIWFSFVLDASGKLSDFELYESAPSQAAGQVQEIVIVGYASKATYKTLTTEDKSGLMKTEVRRIAEKGKGISGNVAPGRYYFKATFRLDRPNPPVPTTTSAPAKQDTDRFAVKLYEIPQKPGGLPVLKNMSGANFSLPKLQEKKGSPSKL